MGKSNFAVFVDLEQVCLNGLLNSPRHVPKIKRIIPTNGGDDSFLRQVTSALVIAIIPSTSFQTD